MVKVIYLENTAGGAKRGDVELMSNNRAHTLIDIGVAKLYKPVANRVTKEMSYGSRKSKRNRPRKTSYRTK